MINNTFVLTDENEFVTLFGGTRANPKALVVPNETDDWYWPFDATIYNGEFKNNKKHGIWEKKCNFSGGGTCLCAPDTISFRKSYKEGQLDGRQWIWDKIEDRRAKGRMKNGLKHGRWIYAIRPPICGSLWDLITNGGFSNFQSKGRYFA